MPAPSAVYIRRAMEVIERKMESWYQAEGPLNCGTALPERGPSSYTERRATRCARKGSGMLAAGAGIVLAIVLADERMVGASGRLEAKPTAGIGVLPSAAGPGFHSTSQGQAAPALSTGCSPIPILSG
jgi:hypothetical protein